MPVPSDGEFVFKPTQEKGGKETISVPSIAKIPRTFAMVEASADGNDAKFVATAMRNLNRPGLLDQLRALSAEDWDRFMDEWKAFSRMSVGE